jgi:hypothetical protein
VEIRKDQTTEPKRLEAPTGGSSPKMLAKARKKGRKGATKSDSKNKQRKMKLRRAV